MFIIKITSLTSQIFASPPPGYKEFKNLYLKNFFLCLVQCSLLTMTINNHQYKLSPYPPKLLFPPLVPLQQTDIQIFKTLIFIFIILNKHSLHTNKIYINHHLNYPNLTNLRFPTALSYFYYTIWRHDIALFSLKNGNVEIHQFQDRLRQKIWDCCKYIYNN